MGLKQHDRRSVTCRCGAVQLEATGAPILTASCHCASCQEAGRRLEQLPAASPILDPDGGTGFVLHRKDRVRCAAGGENLQEHRLKADATTRRVLATCCNSAMFLEFRNGHWLSIYRNRFSTDVPDLEMRVMTQDRRAGAEFADDVPSYKRHSVKFMVKLLSAWISMGLRAPKVTWVRLSP